MEESTIPHSIEVFEKLRRYARLNRHIHFNASKRYRYCHILAGVPCEGHRQLGHRCGAIARERERLIAMRFDKLIDLPEPADTLKVLEDRYGEINYHAEHLNVSDRDFRRAETIQRNRAITAPFRLRRMRRQTFSGNIAHADR